MNNIISILRKVLVAKPAPDKIIKPRIWSRSREYKLCAPVPPKYY